MEKIHSSLSNIIEECLPYREHTIKYKQIRREPWLTACLKISIEKNKKYYAKMLRHEYSSEKYKAYNSTLHKTIRHAKKKYYSDMCYDYRCQTKKLWSVINEVSGKRKNKSGLIEYLKIDRIKEYNSQKISNRFADYFAGVGKKFTSKISQPKKSVSDYLKFLCFYGLVQL